jgi:hypothetical protein
MWVWCTTSPYFQARVGLKVWGTSESLARGRGQGGVGVCDDRSMKDANHRETHDRTAARREHPLAPLHSSG